MRRVLALIGASGEGDGPGVLRREGFEWKTPPSLASLLSAIAKDPPEVVLLSAAAEGVDGAVIELAAESIRSKGGHLFLSSPRASLELAVLARQATGHPLLREPLSAEEVRSAVRTLLAEPGGIRIPAPAGEEEEELIGSGAAMMETVRMVAEVGDSPVTVLITGESGTGKELVARALHRTSSRSGGPFVAINCAAVPESLLESEFFGHERGAFTGAVARKKGRFERAHGGTLFLDEVGDMSLVLQAKLLRTLEERAIERVGGEGTIPVDVRVVAATNRQLERRVAEGEFRNDLFYRLSVARIHLSPLRDRMEDLPELVIHLIRRFSHRYGEQITGITSEALRLLEGHDWPGNVRELANVLDGAVVACSGGWIRAEDLRIGADSPRVSSRSEGAAPGGFPPTASLEEVEREHISAVLAFTGGAMERASDILGIHRNTLRRKMELYGLRGGET